MEELNETYSDSIRLRVYLQKLIEINEEEEEEEKWRTNKQHKNKQKKLLAKEPWAQSSAV